MITGHQLDALGQHIPLCLVEFRESVLLLSQYWFSLNFNTGALLRSDGSSKVLDDGTAGEEIVDVLVSIVAIVTIVVRLIDADVLHQFQRTKNGTSAFFVR